MTAGCSPTPPPAACDADAQSISAIQGTDWYSPVENQPATVRGVVTALEPGRGFYLEQPGDGRRGKASRALFIADDGRLDGILPGQELLLSGVVEEAGSERDTITALAAIQAHTVCAENRELPLTTIELPLGNRAREALEGMRIRVAGELAVTDTYSLYRGAVTLSEAGPLRVPTEDVQPGAVADEMAQRNRQRSLVAQLPGDVPVLQAGTIMNTISGVLGHDGRRQRLLTGSLPKADIRLPEALPPATPGVVRVVNSNLLNFFNGDGRGGGFPTERGARSPAEFREQQARTAAAFAQMRPDLIAVQELENDGFGRDSAAATLRNLLSDATGDSWAVIEPATPRIGDDVITVGLFYRPDRLQAIGAREQSDRLQAIGPPHVLASAEFQGISRQPLAQVFEPLAGGARFLVVVNHLKSKGSCPDEGPNRAQGDGQGCWNAARTRAVRAQIPWLRQLAVTAGTERILVLGDMNAWRLEDPIRAFHDAGLVDVVEEAQGLPQHSYRYFGQGGTLDYAFASPSLAKAVRDARIWHINADWPRNMELPRPWLRMSDHDPVIVDLDFSQASISD